MLCQPSVWCVVINALVKTWHFMHVLQWLHFSLNAVSSFIQALIKFSAENLPHWKRGRSMLRILTQVPCFFSQYLLATGLVYTDWKLFQGWGPTYLLVENDGTFATYGINPVCHTCVVWFHGTSSKPSSFAMLWVAVRKGPLLLW